MSEPNTLTVEDFDKAVAQPCYGKEHSLRGGADLHGETQ